ncbi:hypothetical protein G9A89_019849 [Geosiphon pyriformis]|nr:hypothetical protein G9A89_019849 [Geosiphon pyriformis]
MITTKTKSKKAAPDICPEISNKISTKKALSVVEATRQNILEVFFLPISPNIASTPTKSPKVFNNRLVNKLHFFFKKNGQKDQKFKKVRAVTCLYYYYTESLCDGPRLTTGCIAKYVLEAKQSPSVGSPVLENWADQIETELSPSPVSGAISSSFAGWMVSTLVSGTTFKIKLAYVKASVLKDNVKLFCVKFASQSILNAAFLIELTSSVHFASLKIAKSLVVSEFGSSPAAVALCDVLLSMFAANIKSALSVFGEVSHVVLKSTGVWQYVIVYFKELDTAVSAFNYWSILVDKDSKQHSKNNFKVATTLNTTTLEYYQSIYTHCKQKFNIPDGIEIVKKSVYQYIENRINNYLFGNYNISEVRSNLYNNLAHYSQLETEDLNSETLATYFHELNFNIIKYCEETYPSQYTIDFESETETSNKGKNKLKQYSKTTPNTSTLPKTTANHLQTPEQGTKDFTSLRSPTRQQEPLQTSSNLLDFLSENQSEHSETAANKENNSEITEEELIDSENKEDEMTTYIAKIFEFNGEDIETSPQEWLDQVTKAGDANRWNEQQENGLKTAAPFNDWNAFKAAFLEQFTDNNISITLQPSKSVMTYIGKFNKLFRQIRQLETNNYYSNAQILDQFITGLKDKLIKKICPHVPEDLNSAIQHAKRYEMAIEETNCTKLVNLAIKETSSAAEEKIDQFTKKVENYFTNQQQQQSQRYQPPQRRNQNNFAPLSNNQPQNCHYSYYPPRPQYQNNYYQPASQPIQQQYQQPLTQHYQVPARRLFTQNQFTPQNRYQVNNNRISSNNQLVLRNSTQLRPNHYLTQPSYLTMPEEQDFHYTAPSEGRAAAQQQNSSYILTTIPPARIAKNANFSDIFPFEFEANELSSLLSNAAANEQKAITAMYTEAEVEEKTIRLILDSESARSIITYQLMQQLKRNTPVGEIDNFPFTLDGITIPVKVLVMDTLQYQAFVRNDWLQKANANLNWKTQELTISYQGQHTWVPATCSTFNKHSEKAPAFEFEPEEEKLLIETFMALGSTKQRPYIPLKCKDCHKKLSSMGACILPEKEYENHTCYYCKTCHRE